MTELIIQTGKHQGKKIDLAGQDCLIGRHESCKIRIASGEVSKQHCRLKHKAGGVHVKDLGSRNGTFVNDKILDKEVSLKAGDLLRVGPMVFLVSEGKTAARATAEVSQSPAPSKIENGPTSKPPSPEEDLIAAWLSEEDIEKSGNDSTIVMPSPVRTPDEKPDAEQTSLSTHSTGGATSQKTVKERAAEIIRRYHRMKQEEKG